MSEQATLKSFFGKRKDREDGDEKPKSPAADSEASTSTKKQSGPKRERNFQSIWLEKYKWLLPSFE